MKLSIHIDSENSGCRTREDICRILEKLLPKIRLAGTESKHKIRDLNGNEVGWYSISADDEDEDTEEEEEDSSVPEQGKVIKIPLDFPVQPLKPTDQATCRVTCMTCGLSWDYTLSTTYTPTPSSRCPFEYFHLSEDTE